jgi:hypothetical protein
MLSATPTLTLSTEKKVYDVRRTETITKIGLKKKDKYQINFEPRNDLPESRPPRSPSMLQAQTEIDSKLRLVRHYYTVKHLFIRLGNGDGAILFLFFSFHRVSVAQVGIAP